MRVKDLDRITVKGSPKDMVLPLSSSCGIPVKSMISPRRRHISVMTFSSQLKLGVEVLRTGI